MKPKLALLPCALTLAFWFAPALAPGLAWGAVAAPALQRGGQANPGAASSQQPTGAPDAPGSAVPAGAPAALQDGEVPPIQLAGDFFIINLAESENAADGLGLLQFIRAAQEATGKQFMLPGGADTVKQIKLQMFGTKRIPKAEFYSFFQIILFINDFACVEVGPPHLQVVVIQPLSPSSQQARGTGVLQKPVYVTEERLQEYADQPAVLIRTLVHLPHIDVRTLQTQLRTLLPNTNLESVIVIASSNMIITGFGSNVAALVNLLYLADEASKGEDTVEPVFDVMPLEFAAPETVADLIEQLLEARTKAINDSATAAAARNAEGGGVRPRSGTEPKILVDGRTSSLLVMAMPEDMPMIKDLVARLDVEVVEPERNYHIYTLENVKAKELAETLKDFLDDANRLTESQTGTGGRAPGATGGTGGGDSNEVIVVEDEVTNSLLIAANKTRYEEVLELIRQLDRRQDQVLIETALIELTGTDLRQLGVELGFATIPDPSEEGGFGITDFGFGSYLDTDSDGIVDVKTPSITSGITGGIIDGDDFALPVLLKAVNARTDSNVLNVPSVLVNNNGQAKVLTKDEQPTTTITASGGVGGQTQENFNGYQEAGIELTISPSISASRYLRLTVDLKVSNFLGSVSGAIPPPRITRQIVTEVNVPDGDTMVVGGIITDNLRKSREGVPYLMDIPVLGALFRNDNDNQQRTTLYFFVTPHILRESDFSDLAEISYRKKLEAAEVMGADRLRTVDPAFGQKDDESWLEGFEIPLYKSPGAGETSGSDLGLDPNERAELLRGGSSGPKEASPDSGSTGGPRPVDDAPGEAPETPGS